jgi:hypothetical protein
MTQYTKLSKNLLSESYIPSQNNIKINFNNNLNENRTPTSHTTLSGPKTTKLVNDSVNLENLTLNLNNNNNNNNQKLNNHNAFAKPIFISNFNSSNSFIMNKNERVKSSTILRSNTIKYSKNNYDKSYNYNQSTSIGNQANENNNIIKRSTLNDSIFNENSNNNDELNNSPRYTKKIFNKFSNINNNSNQQNISIDGSKRDFLTVLSNIHRASSINLGREKTNLSSYFSTSPNIYAKNFSNESVNSIGNLQKIHLNTNFKNSDTNLNQSSFGNYQNSINVSNNLQHFKSNNRKQQAVSFRNNLNINNAYNRNYNANDSQITGNLNGNNFNENENESKVSKHINNLAIDKNKTILEKNYLLASNELQYSKFALNQTSSNEAGKLNNLNSIKIFDSNINLNLIKKKTSNLQSKKRSQQLETNELVNLNLNDDNDNIKEINDNNDIIDNNHKIDHFEIEKQEIISKQENQSDNKDYLNINEKELIQNNQDQTKKKLEINKELNSDDEEKINKSPQNEKSQVENNIKKKEANNSKICTDSKLLTNISNISKKHLFSEENAGLIDLNNNNNIQKINKVEINLEKFESIKKPSYFSNRIENQVNKNSKFNNKHFVTTVQPMNHNNISIANGQNSNYRINKSNFDLLLIPPNVQMNNMTKNYENEKFNENIRTKLIRSNSKLSHVSRDVNDSYAYTNVQQYIEENELMPPEKSQSIKKWIKDVNFWFDDWEKRTIELNIEEN